MVVIAILSILFILIIGIFNPFAQIHKSSDAQSKNSIQQIKSALDLYYNDHNCYPTTLNFGGTFQSGSTVYMEKVPQEPDCNMSTGSYCLHYQTDNSSCPSWYVLYGMLYSTNFDGTTFSCPLTALNNCLPTNYNSSGYNFCNSGGNVDCNYINSSTIPAAIPTGNGSGNSTPTPTNSCSKDYACTGGPPARCNIVMPGTGQYCTSNCNGAC